MDRDEALRLLKGGHQEVLEWNDRRNRNERIPDLTDADLHGADLRGANLFGAILDGSKLSGAILVEANLIQASLRGADLLGAALVKARLHMASLVKADLSYSTARSVDFSAAVLSQANLAGAQLHGSQFHGAICASTIFADTDLSQVTALENIVHVGPSTIGIDTLYRSKGKIPESFLRGCGVPERWIEYLPALMEMLEPIPFYSCFISHSSKDQTFADHLYGRMLQEKLRVWYAPNDMQGGQPHDEQIDQAIRIYDKLLLVLSESSMSSNWVRREIRKAREQEEREGRRKLFPIRLVDVAAIKAWECVDPRTGQDYAEEVLRFHIPDFSNWKDHDAFESSFARLLKDLKAEESTGAKQD
jgi:hypothetical protein